MFLIKRMQKNQIFSFNKTKFYFQVSETYERFLRTWFRNAKQWCPATSWLEGFNPKASGAWGWSPQNTKKYIWTFFFQFFFAPILMKKFLHTLQMNLKKIDKKKYFEKNFNFFLANFFLHILSIFWIAFWSSREKIRSKT